MSFYDHKQVAKNPYVVSNAAKILESTNRLYQLPVCQVANDALIANADGRKFRLGIKTLFPSGSHYGTKMQEVDAFH